MEYICARNKTRRKKARKIYIRKYLSYKKRKKVYFPKIDIEIVKDKIKRFSETLNFLSKKSFFSKLNTDNENVRIKIPTVFSVIENPDD